MEDWAEVRRPRRAEGVPIKEIARRMGRIPARVRSPGQRLPQPIVTRRSTMDTSTRPTRDYHWRHIPRTKTTVNSHQRRPISVSLVWAVLDRASRGWRGFTVTTAGDRLRPTLCMPKMSSALLRTGSSLMADLVLFESVVHPIAPAVMGQGGIPRTAAGRGGRPGPAT